MPKIMVVDDLKSNRYLLETLLRSKNYQVVSASNGIEALELMREEDYDLIISDILMPEMDGYQLCRECKKDSRLKKISFVFYTATYTEERDENFALGLGADLFIRKPVEPDKFITIIEKVINESWHKKKKHKKPNLKHEAEIYKIYSQRLVKKLEKKMLDLEKSEKLYRNIFNNANDAVYLHHLNDDNTVGKFIEVNKVASETLGYTREEFLHLTPYDIDDPNELQNASTVLKKLRDTGKVTFQIKHKTKNGVLIPVEVSSNLFMLDEKTVVLSIVRDLTERLKQEEEINLAEQNWQMTFNSMEDVVMVVDSEQIIENINNSGIFMSRKPREEIIGKRCYEVLFDRETPRDSCPFQEVFETGLTQYKECIDEKKARFYSCKCSPINHQDNKIKRFVITMADITEKKNNEIELNKYRDELENLVKERTEILEKKNEELQHYIKIFEHREFRIKELRDELKKLKSEKNE